MDEEGTITLEETITMANGFMERKKVKELCVPLAKHTRENGQII